MTPKALPFTHDEAAQKLLATNSTALVTGMVLYQQIPVEKAFAGPAVLQDRLGKKLTAANVASVDVDDLIEIFRETPAIHRFPANMAKRVHATSEFLENELGGDVSALWADTEEAKAVIKNLKRLPGFGDYKARVYFGVLSKWYDVTPDGWQKFVPDWPSIVDVDSIDDLAELKSRKKAWKEAQK